MFRRAAELDAAGVRGELSAALDDKAVEDIGREVGLSPASVQAALAELRAGALNPRPAVTWGTAIASGTIAGSSDEVLAAVDDEARRNLLGVARRVDGATVWTRSPGASAAVARGLRGRRDHPLLTLRELRAAVVEVPSRPGDLRVRLEGDLVFPWRLLSGRSQVISMAGVAGGAALAFAVPDGALVEDWIQNAFGVAAAAGGTGIGLKSYRRAVTAAEAALEGLLARAGHTVPPTPPFAQRSR